MISKQILLGLVLLVGGAVAMFAVMQNEEANHTISQNTTDIRQESVAGSTVAPLTADLATEEKLLAQKQKEREMRNQQMAKEADELLSEQEQARILALEKAKQEFAPVSADKPISVDKASQSELIAVPARTQPETLNKTVNAKLESTQNSQTINNKTSQHKVMVGDNLTLLSRQYGVPVATIAAANNMAPGDALVLGRIIKIPAATLGATGQAQQAETAKSAKADNKDPASDKNSTGATYSVQVSISPNKAKIDEIVTKYRNAGYQVSTSQTNRGIRVLVGSANSYDEANALKQKISQDSRVDSNGAWVKKMER
ncbi:MULTISPECIES: SPOR domain-containing protein [unclassified Moraxella]|uniref:SPOR domain-containing protein n=1 Tax=unclassified Moraxella TaxID=2685852 RepID=UPI00359D1901